MCETDAVVTGGLGTLYKCRYVRKCKDRLSIHILNERAIAFFRTESSSEEISILIRK